MLKNILGAYLDGIKERQFDLPFTALLHAAGYYDIHFTHGNAEFGKDFIAKRIENGNQVQYSFQSKAGDISQSDWRTDIMGQMLESILSGLSHPNFDKNLPHQAVLVITGRLVGNAPVSFQEFNIKIAQTYFKRSILLWDREDLIPMIENYGLGSVYQTTAAGFIRYGQFYQLYGKALEHHISQREIEEHSRQWIDESIEPAKRLLCSAIESDIFSSQCQAKGMLYEAIISRLTTIRTIMHQLQTANDANNVQQLLELYQQAVVNLKLAMYQYIDEFKIVWEKANNDLSRITPGPNNIMTYLIHCSRIMEISGLLYFIENKQEERKKTVSFLVDFISKEPGCAHIPSDFYAISLVLPVLLLCSDDNRSVARQLLQRATVWLCDRYQKGIGLADLSANQFEETAILCCYPFDFIKVQQRRGSFASSIICDLAAFTSDSELYSNIINDIKASNIFPQYWQVPDNLSLFTIGGRDIIQYPNIEYSEVYLSFDSFSFAEHISHEPRLFALTNRTGIIGLYFLMPLLRDRYFPTMWSLITNQDSIKKLANECGQ